MKETETEKKNKGLIILQAICEICFPFVIIGTVFFFVIINVELSQFKKNNTVIENLNVIDSLEEFENYLEASSYNNDKVIIDIENEEGFYTEAKGRLTEDGEPYDERSFYIYGHKFDYEEDYDSNELFDSVRETGDYPLWLIVSSEIDYSDDNEEEIVFNGYSLGEKNELFTRNRIELYRGDYPDYFELNEENFRKSHLFRMKILGLLVLIIIVMYIINRILKPKLYPVDKSKLAETEDK